MQDFMIFVAPFIVLFISISAAFYLALKDRTVTEDKE